MGLFSNLASKFRVRQPDEIELAYLNQAMSPVDLEMRQREVDRGRFRTRQRFYY